MPSSQDPRPDVPESHRPVGMFIILTSLAVITAAVLTSQPLQSANDRSRWSTVWSLVERGTYQIDEIDQYENWSSIDKVRHRVTDDEPWHFYSSKPPLLSTIVAGLYWIERQVLGRGLFHDTEFVSRLLLLLVNVVPMAVALFSLRRTLQLLKIPPTAFRFVLLAAGLGSMLNPFLTTLNNHTPAAVCLLICLSAIIRLGHASTGDQAGRDFWIMGLTAALTCCFELPAALFGIVAFLFAVRVDVSRSLTCFVPAAVIPLAAFFVTNWLATGGIKPFYAYYGQEQYVYVHEGVPSYWSNPKDLDANQESTPVYLFHCLIGHHGILSLTPVFLLTLAGWWMGAVRQEWRSLKFVLLTGAGLSLAVLGFYLTKTANYNYGGNSSSLRWMLWLVPFWWYGMIPAVVWITDGRPSQRPSQRAALSVVIGMLLAMSVFTASWSLSKPWKPSWLYSVMEQAGWINYHTPAEPFSTPRYSVISSVPDGPGRRASWSSANGAATQTLTLTTIGPVSVDDHPAVAVRLNLSDGSREQRSPATDPDRSAKTSPEHVLVILIQPFESGSDIADWLRQVRDPATNTEARLTSAQVEPADDWILTLLRGMPAARPYNAGGKKYQRPFDEAAIALECDRAASRVAFDHPQFGRCWQRCDVLYCAELTFGVMQWTTTITQEATGDVISVTAWRRLAD
ncbi:MAG: hypothetical protein R3C19_08115 [Planctomycetaceae bacterium]